jgi:hypothetical protein
MNLLKHALLTFATFFIPIQGILLLLIGVVSIDTIMAIYVSIKLRGFKSFKSALLRKGMTAKIFLYLGTVMLAFSVDSFIMGGSLFGIQYLLAKGLASVWIFGELKSMDENSIKLGNRSFAIILKEFFKKITGYKDDIKKIVE